MISLKQHVLSAIKCQVKPELIKEAIYQLPEIPKHIMTYDKKS